MSDDKETNESPAPDEAAEAVEATDESAPEATAEAGADSEPEAAAEAESEEAESSAGAASEEPESAEEGGEGADEPATEEPAAAAAEEAAPEEAAATEEPAEAATPEAAAPPEASEYDYHTLNGMNVAQLREVAATIEHDAVHGYTTMHKEHLVPAICKALGIEAHEHHEVVGIDKEAVKAKIRALKKERDEAEATGDKARLKLTRRRIRGLKRKIRKATV